MAQNFIACDRDQELLLPPSVREWLPEDHFAWFVLEAVEELDLTAFYGAYRVDGHGRPAHDPGMMVALLLYAYARGQRSSRGIERGCIEDIAYRVIAANRVPDHCTIARFRQRHEDALAGLFGEVLGLCARAGLVQSGVIAVDGTKIHASASERANCDYEQLAREILEEADEVDRLRTSSSVSAAAMSCRRSCRRRRVVAAGCARPSASSKPSARRRRGRSRLRDRRGPGRPSGAWRKNCSPRSHANIAYEAYRARGVMRNGRGSAGRPSPTRRHRCPAGKINLTDPDSRNLKTPRGYLQGYNAQAVVTADQIVIAAEVNNVSADFGQLEPMITSALEELDAGRRSARRPRSRSPTPATGTSLQIDALVERGHPGR